MANGDKVTVSLKASAVLALQVELSAIEVKQMTLAEDMTAMLYKQMELARKSRDLHHTLEKLLK